MSRPGLRRGLAALAIALLGAGAARAQEARYYREGKDYVHEISGVIQATTPRVRVESDLGAVAIRAGEASEVRYRIRVRVAGRDDAAARALLDDLRVSAGRTGDTILFQGEAALPETTRGLSAEFDLVVPRGTRQIDVTTGAGGVSVRGVEGPVRLSTRGGEIAADDLGGPLQAETQGGGIEIGTVRGAARLSTAGGNIHLAAARGEVTAQTSGGDVSVGEAAAGVRAETGGGNVAIESAGGDVVAGTSGGNIRLGTVRGKVSAATAGGAIRVGSAGSSVRCETAAGSIDLHAGRGPVRAVTSAGTIRADFGASREALTESDLQAWQGDVTVILGETQPVTIRALVDSPAGHRIKSDFPLRISRESEGGGRPLEVAEGSIAGGGALLKLRTLAGDIIILKAKNATP
ncbi:MAG TPA: hypothetical protein VFT43_16285 [Candidatus Polarisedimenticolia bacterium]|nr:hypothetical protein [Candidatus Polarisedimenticolia bacterium]